MDMSSRRTRVEIDEMKGSLRMFCDGKSKASLLS